MSPVSLNHLTPPSLTEAQTRRAAVALAMFVYDYMLTFEDEVRYIWRRPVTNVKVLYIVLRYGVAFAELVYFQGESSRNCPPNQAQHLYLTCSPERIDNTYVTQRAYPVCAFPPS
jgi:hypothetical protein